MARSLAKAGLLEGMEVRIAAPEGYAFSPAELSSLRAFGDAAGRGGTIELSDDPAQAAKGAAALYTDVWTSMGQEQEMAVRRAAFAGYTIDEQLVGLAADDAVVLHCLPAHRGEEITNSVLEGPRSVVWKQAAHRRTAMRGILTWAVQPPGHDMGKEKTKGKGSSKSKGTGTGSRNGNSPGNRKGSRRGRGGRK
jgi:ornithine carbamoyltransferase